MAHTETPILIPIPLPMLLSTLPAVVLALAQGVNAMQRGTAIVNENGDMVVMSSEQAETREATPVLDYWKGNCSYNKVLRVMDFKSSLANEMLATPHLSVGFPNHAGCSSHFYHLILNYAVPLYGKMVEPFRKRHQKVPRVNVHVHDTGGTVKLLQDMIPELSFKFEPWVCECCQNICRGVSKHTKERSPLPSYALSSDWFIGMNGYKSAASKGIGSQEVKQHRLLLQRFSAYILQHHFVPQSQSQRLIAFIGRKKDPRFTSTMGGMRTGSEKRALRNSGQVFNGISMLANKTPNTVFKRYFPEDYSFKEQIGIFSHANMLLGVHGAGMTQCMWLPKKSQVITMTSKSKAKKFFSWLCGNVMGHRYDEFMTDGWFVPMGNFMPFMRRKLKTM